MLTYIYIQPFQMCLVAAKSMRHGEGRVRATRVSTNMAILQGLRGFSLPQTLTPLQHSSNRATHRRTKLLRSSSINLISSSLISIAFLPRQTILFRRIRIFPTSDPRSGLRYSESKLNVLSLISIR